MIDVSAPASKGMTKSATALSIDGMVNEGFSNDPIGRNTLIIFWPAVASSDTI